MEFKLIKLLGAFLLLGVATSFAGTNKEVESSNENSTEKRPPNVIVILTDDQGYADLGFHDKKEFPASQDVLTPNLDALASSGIFFRNGYVANATCGPSRSSLLTGRACSRFGMEENNNWENGDTGPLNTEIFLPKVIKEKGYVSGAFGKWHMGSITPDVRPIGRGFDYFWGNDDYALEEDIAHGYYKDYTMKRSGLDLPPCWKNGEYKVPAYGKYLTDAVTDEALSFIKRNKDNPFFAYVAYHAPHSPFTAKEATIKRIVKHQPKFQSVYNRLKTKTDMWYKSGNDRTFDHKAYRKVDDTPQAKQELTEELRLIYLAMLLTVDDGVGKIVSLLEDEELLENTLVFYLSDNGGALARPVDFGCVNLPLRSGKGTVYDGGVRVPYVMSWKGKLPAGEISDLVVSSMDIFTTTVELAGAKVPTDRVIDGVNLLPYLIGNKKGEVAHDYLFFRRYKRNIYSIRVGDLKLVRNITETEKNNRGTNPKLHPIGGSLYDIQNDITELNDISSSQTEQKAVIQKIYDQDVKILPVPGLLKK
ncbi:sulfatase-like hydrolase/transferase [uncultured Draconibacterium sp.]|uniref:sulfatase-like hydrolase/transferase n=1 Tax=uncultured Draconibacterium sp. TaxID=1573823 RepID=UPI0029BFD800|nr:sulfatase-like hydrolase/transferase [uncultured Draconibacterium sp.]